jgi:hypothetical protein
LFTRNCRATIFSSWGKLTPGLSDNVPLEKWSLGWVLAPTSSMKLGNPVCVATLSQNGYNLSEEIGTYFSTGNRPNRIGWKFTGCVNVLTLFCRKVF